MIRPPSPCSRIRIAAARAHVNVPAQVRRDHEVEVLVGHLPEHAVAQDARVRDHHIEPPELADARSRRARSRGLGVADRADLGDGAPAGAGDRATVSSAAASSRSLTTTAAPAAASAIA